MLYKLQKALKSYSKKSFLNCFQGRTFSVPVIPAHQRFSISTFSSQVFAADICFRSSLSKQKQPGFIPTVRKLFLILCLDLFDVIRLVFCQIKCREHLRVRQLHIKALCAVYFKLCFINIKLKYMTAVRFIL